MFRSLFDLLLGCSHQRTTFPITPARRNVAPGATRNATYVVCLDCGKEFDYNWKDMRVGRQLAPRAPEHAEVAHSPGYWTRPTEPHPHEGPHTV
jgi:hypothetical protein